jgi:serine phosphatase RsbU (regulator of sigma subunit)
LSEQRPTTLDQAALQRLLDISAEILGQLDIDRLLSSIMTGAADLLDASQINLYRYVPSRDLLETWIPLRAPASIVRLELRRGEGLAGRVLVSGRGLRIDDYDQWEGRSSQWPVGVTGPSMGVPVRRSEELLGLITVARPPGSPLFADSDLALLQLFANQAAVAIANAQLYAGVTRRADELSKLYDTSLDMVGQLDLASVLEATLERATSLLDCSANLRLYDPEKDLLIPLLPLKQPDNIAYASLKPGEGLSGRVFVTGEPLVVNDYDRWEGRSSQYAPGVIARGMAAPLRQAGDLIGVLALDRAADRPPFTDDDLRLLTLFANQASIAISNARSYTRATRRADELARLYETSLDVVSQLELGRVLEATLERATSLLDSRYANLRLYDRDLGLLMPLLRLNQPDASLQVPLKPGEGLSGRVFLSSEPLIVNDYDNWDGRSPEYPAGSVPRAMGVPLRQAGEVIGVLAVDRTSERPPFNQDDLRLLSLFANQAAVAITNARQVEQLKHFHSQQIEKERLDQQLRMGQAVQAGLLPAELPVIPGWDLAALWHPALQLGGDYYDFIPLAPDCWGLLMADVSDKGIPAALLMAVARTLFRVYASADLSPRETLARVNRDLVASSHSGMFVTAVYAVADTRTGEVRIASAGHPPALVVHHPGREVQPIRVGGMPLGILEEATFHEEAIRLQPGEGIVLYTDGITEASDDGGEQFGPARLHALLGQTEASSAHQLIAAVDDAVRSFVGETPVSDDVAYLVIRRQA